MYIETVKYLNSKLNNINKKFIYNSDNNIIVNYFLNNIFQEKEIYSFVQILYNEGDNMYYLMSYNIKNLFKILGYRYNSNVSLMFNEINIEEDSLRIVHNSKLLDNLFYYGLSIYNGDTKKKNSNINLSIFNKPNLERIIYYEGSKLNVIIDHIINSQIFFNDFYEKEFFIIGKLYLYMAKHYFNSKTNYYLNNSNSNKNYKFNEHFKIYSNIAENFYLDCNKSIDYSNLCLYKIFSLVYNSKSISNKGIIIDKHLGFGNPNYIETKIFISSSTKFDLSASMENMNRLSIYSENINNQLLGTMRLSSLDSYSNINHFVTNKFNYSLTLINQSSIFAVVIISFISFAIIYKIFSELLRKIKFLNKIKTDIFYSIDNICIENNNYNYKIKSYGNSEYEKDLNSRMSRKSSILYDKMDNSLYSKNKHIKLLKPNKANNYKFIKIFKNFNKKFVNLKNNVFSNKFYNSRINKKLNKSNNISEIKFDLDKDRLNILLYNLKNNKLNLETKINMLKNNLFYEIYFVVVYELKHCISEFITNVENNNLSILDSKINSGLIPLNLKYSNKNSKIREIAYSHTRRQQRLLSKFNFLVETDYIDANKINYLLSKIDFLDYQHLAYNMMYSKSFVNNNLNILYRLLDTSNNNTTLFDKKCNTLEINEIIKIIYDFDKNVLSLLINNIVNKKKRNIINKNNSKMLLIDINALNTKLLSS